jgi:hypothetical protein
MEVVKQRPGAIASLGFDGDNERETSVGVLLTAAYREAGRGEKKSESNEDSTREHQRDPFG